MPSFADGGDYNAIAQRMEEAASLAASSWSANFAVSCQEAMANHKRVGKGTASVAPIDRTDDAGFSP
jgi:hypothetical protein